MVAVTHTKVTAKSGTSDSTLIQPTDWNAGHTFVTSGSNAILGVNGGAGPVVENSCLPWAFSFIAAADLPTAMNAVGIGAFTTGDVKLTFKTVADTGWVLMNDSTIGDAASGASYANANASALFTVLWSNTVNADCPVSGGRGVSAAADFGAHKTLTLPLQLGRALAVAGSGSGLTARALGHAVGVESLAIAQTYLPNIQVTFSGTAAAVSFSDVDPQADTVSTSSANSRSSFSYGSTGATLYVYDLAARMAAAATVTATGGVVFPVTGGAQTNNHYMGDGTAFPVMQPTTFLNVMIKL